LIQHVDKTLRQQTISHNIEVIKYGIELGSGFFNGMDLSNSSSFLLIKHRKSISKILGEA